MIDESLMGVPAGELLMFTETTAIATNLLIQFIYIDFLSLQKIIRLPHFYPNIIVILQSLISYIPSLAVLSNLRKVIASISPVSSGRIIESFLIDIT